MRTGLYRRFNDNCMIGQPLNLLAQTSGARWLTFARV